jgi:hypothetical protein
MNLEELKKNLTALVDADKARITETYGPDFAMLVRIACAMSSIADLAKQMDAPAEFVDLLTDADSSTMVVLTRRLGLVDKTADLVREAKHHYTLVDGPLAKYREEKAKVDAE